MEKVAVRPCRICGTECKGAITDEGVSPMNYCGQCMADMRLQLERSLGVRTYSYDSSYVEVDWEEVAWLLAHTQNNVSERTRGVRFTDRELRQRLG